VRIISGSYRGKQIHPPRGMKARPTTDQAKEGLFNILIHRFDLEALDVLDLFAGTGSITYEFASRGTRSVVAVESDTAYFRFIRKTISELGFENVTVIRGDVFRYLRHPYQSFDIIFADPPYDHPDLIRLPDLVFSSEILAKDGWFILEHPRHLTFTAHPMFNSHRRYGGVNFSIFSRSGVS
jgi:16S rRNA (guanine966-N2)-methyltransferase